MMRNRSMLADTFLAHTTYRNLAEAFNWLRKALGSVERDLHGDSLSEVRGHPGKAWLMENVSCPGHKTCAELGFWTECLTAFLADVEAH